MKKALLVAAGAVVLASELAVFLEKSPVSQRAGTRTVAETAEIRQVIPLAEVIDASEPAEAKAEDDQKQQLPFHVLQDGLPLQQFDTFVEAAAYARGYADASIRFSKDERVVWSNQADLPETAMVEGVPLLNQMPELERGCEVTSLAMVLGFDGTLVDKMTLADEVKKDPAPFEVIDGEIHFGNPNNGFVGNMETFDENGLGVYHGPIAELAENYAPGRVLDLTGADFEDLLRFTAVGLPVWVIDNLTYEPLSDDEFETWQTEDGPIDITYQEHSVVITGYTPDTIILNDPIEGETEADRASFAESWAQMGSQAIVILPKTEADPKPAAS